MKKILFSVGLILLCALKIYSSDGQLDPTFGVNGVITAPGGNSNAIAIQTDGKIVTVGFDATGNFFQTTRYNTDGSIDGTFGVGGIVVGPASPFPATVLIQPDDKIVVGSTDNDGNTLLIRYLSDGTLDSTFGIDGIATGTAGALLDIALETAGTIIGAGEASTNFFVARYNSNGTINTVFSGSIAGFANSLALQNDGKIVVSGQNASGFVTVLRYLPNGTLDPAFGTGGLTMGPMGSDASIIVQPNGQLLVGSSGGTFPNNFFQATQFNANGSINTGYGVGGTAMGPCGVALALKLQSDGKGILVGQTDEIEYFQVARFTTTGNLDTSFGNGLGYVTVPLGFGHAAAIQTNGDIVVAGTDETETIMQLARYLVDPAIVPTQIITPADGSGILPGTVNFTGTAQNPANVYLLLDGTIIGGVATAPGAANSWSFSITLTPGTYTAQAVALYEDGSVNIASPEITFTVAETLLNATKTDSTNGENVRNCSTLTYTITVTNTGPVEAHKVLVTDTLPTGVTFVTASTSNGKSVSQSGGVVTAMLGGIDVGDTVTVTITVQVKASVIGSLVNTAVVSGLNTQNINLTDTVVVAQTCTVNCIVTCS
jgi:uncharacterized repeat protein (TIGR01451 family)/uncharacterized delta-60 repeat protein